MSKFIIKRKFESKKIIITLVLALVIIMVFIIITMLTSKKYDLSNYITINEYGYDGAGTIDVQIDSKRYLKDCHSENQLTDIDYIEIIADTEQNGNLSNNSSTTISFSSVNNQIKFIPIYHTVSKLKNTTPIDVFENLQIKFIGADGAGTATINTEKCKDIVQAGVSYSVYPDKELSNGDVITVIAKEKNSNLLSSGYTIKSEQKEYTVKDLPIYPTSLTNVNCNNCDTYLEKYITELVQQNSISYPWEFDKKLTSDWYLLGNFEYEYVITPMESYFLYKSDNLQKNEYCSVYKVEMSAKCTNVYSNINALKDKIKVNNISKNTEINGTLYFSITANGVYLNQQKKNLVLPMTDSNYNSDYYGRSYMGIKYDNSFYQLKKSITENSNFDTVICINN